MRLAIQEANSAESNDHSALPAKVYCTHRDKVTLR